MRFDPIDDAACVLGPWSAPEQQVALSSPQTDWAPALSSDGLEIVYLSNRTGNFDLYYASRASTSDPFGPATRMSQSSTTIAEGSPAFADDLTLFYDNSTGGTFKVTRPTRGDPFGTPVAAPEVSNLGAIAIAFTADLEEMFYGDTSVRRATRSGSTYVATGAVNELGQGGYPSVSGDGLTIYFVTSRNGPLELFSAVRPDRISPFGVPSAVTELLVGGDGDDPALSTDDRTIVFRSTRATGDVGEIYRSQRSCQ
jgi:Tol biopolymer transport system component